MEKNNITFNTKIILGTFFLILLFPSYLFSSENNSDENKYVLKKYSSESNYGGNISKNVMENFYDDNWNNVKTISEQFNSTGPAQKTITIKSYEGKLLKKEKSTVTVNGEIQVTTSTDNYYSEDGIRIKQVTVSIMNQSGQTTKSINTYGESSEYVPVEMISETEINGNKSETIMKNTLDSCGYITESVTIINGKPLPTKLERKHVTTDDCRLLSIMQLSNGQLYSKSETTYSDDKQPKKSVTTNYLPTGESKSVTMWEYDDLGRTHKMISKQAEGTNIVTYEWTEKK